MRNRIEQTVIYKAFRALRDIANIERHQSNATLNHNLRIAQHRRHRCGLHSSETHFANPNTFATTGTRAQVCISSSPQRYTIKSTETLRSVSQSTGVPLQALLAANPALTQPSKVPNATINIPCGHQGASKVMSSPAETCEIMHTTADNGTDTCESVAERYDVSVSMLEDLNPDLNMSSLCGDMQLPAGLRLCLYNVTEEEYMYATRGVYT